ncbi:hypothetical protein AAFF_G00299460 [Aldrovandia affinis]|uniref:Uncharacterized protein n=1 Tax=Aldrovandia affinis TaxID=143900 RepID=A0AAD7W0E8_9TELE|nr:hypothetical protein AAFF_G00299460 [Aldrovandia affinis]
MSFQAALRGLQEETEALLKGRQSCAQTAEHIKSQAHDTERGIREEFKRLHHFLRDEETARIAALREEEEQKSQMMTERMDTLTKYISSLSDRIGTGEEAMEGANPSSLQVGIHKLD